MRLFFILMLLLGLTACASWHKKSVNNPDQAYLQAQQSTPVQISANTAQLYPVPPVASSASNNGPVSLIPPGSHLTLYEKKKTDDHP